MYEQIHQTFQTQAQIASLDGQDVITPAFITFMVVPIDQQGNAARVPTSIQKFPLHKQQAVQLRDELNELIELVPDPPKKSDLITATSMQGVDQIADLDANLRG